MTDGDHGNITQAGVHAQLDRNPKLVNGFHKESISLANIIPGKSDGRIGGHAVPQHPNVYSAKEINPGHDHVRGKIFVGVS